MSKRTIRRSRGPRVEAHIVDTLKPIIAGVTRTKLDAQRLACMGIECTRKYGEVVVEPLVVDVRSQREQPVRDYPAGPGIIDIQLGNHFAGRRRDSRRPSVEHEIIESTETGIVAIAVNAFEEREEPLTIR